MSRAKENISDSYAKLEAAALVMKDTAERVIRECRKARRLIQEDVSTSSTDQDMSLRIAHSVTKRHMTIMKKAK